MNLSLKYTQWIGLKHTTISFAEGEEETYAENIGSRKFKVHI